MKLTADTVVAMTGASRGIGRALALALAGRRVRLALLARSGDALEALEPELRRIGAPDVLIREGDVGDPETATVWIKAILERWGRLDALVNNAGVGIMKPVAELSDGDWDTVLATNLSGPFRLMRAAIPAMRAAGGGHIVNVSSVAGEVGFVGGGAYCASKFGLNGLSECLMQEVRREGIKVTLVGPGSVDTRFEGSGGEGRPGETAWKIPPEEIARTIIYALEAPRGTMATKIQVRPTLQDKP
jgi:NAD(P)-dependent dehydrogenase (short-subunit alcohol dehydrogenase family)